MEALGGHRSLEGNNLGGTASIALDMAIEDDVRVERIVSSEVKLFQTVGGLARPI